MSDEKPFGGDDPELLRKDFDHWLSSFAQNEELGDRRLNFFTTIVTGVFGALGFLAKDGKDTIAGLELTAIMAYASLLLFLLGCVTTVRLKRRRDVTAGYLKAADRLRHILAPEWAKEYRKHLPTGSGGILRFGGLTHVSAVLNAGLLGVLVWSAMRLLGTASLTSMMVSFGALVVCLVTQWVYLGKD